MIVGNMIGGNPLTPKTYIFVTEDGQEMPGVLVGSEMILTATANDIRKDSVAVTDTGVTTGTKVIPAYHTTEGYRAIPNGSEYSIPFYDDLGYCEYTKLMVIICSYNTSIANSVSAEKVVINDNVYAVNSTSSLSTVTVNATDKKIFLGITNDSGSPVILRYFTYKEIT